MQKKKDVSQPEKVDRFERQRKYDKANTKPYALKLNLKTDADIIKKLSEVDSIQGYIKELIRKDLNK